MARLASSHARCGARGGEQCAMQKLMKWEGAGVVSSGGDGAHGRLGRQRVEGRAVVCQGLPQSGFGQRDHLPGLDRQTQFGGSVQIAV